MNRQLKYVSNIFDDLYSRKYINYKNQRLKSIYLVNIIDMFLNHYITFNRDNIKISSRIFKIVYGPKYKYYLDYLMDHNFIYLYKNYSVGLKSKSYRLTDMAKVPVYNSVNIDVPTKLSKKINDINSKSGITVIDKHIKERIIQNLYSIDIDTEKAKDWLNINIEKNSLKYTSNINAINKLTKKDLNYAFDSYGRFHTNFTNLKREIREQFLTIDNKPIKEIDIKNSQPFFLYVLMKRSGFNDFNGFDTDVLTGEVYEKLINYSNENISRKDMKVNVYSVLFGRTFTKNKWNILFSNKYPEVYEWIKQYKKENKNYKCIARTLQLLESKFMFEKLIPNLLIKVPDLKFITVHDSIIVQEKYYDQVKNEFYRLLNLYTI